jgi:hypothetical protein
MHPSQEPQAGKQDRVIALGPGLPMIPERLLLAHARGEVLFIAGAGVSQPANMPSFKGLVLDVYQRLDTAVHAVIQTVPIDACNKWASNLSGLTAQQSAEVRRFITGDFDVVLGMLERRIDGAHPTTSRVRQAIASTLQLSSAKPAPIHRAIMKLADRGGVVTIATTNFEQLLESAAKSLRPRVQSYSLGGIPRPGRRKDFAGVMHIHGMVEKNKQKTSELIVTDQDFGEFYLRRRVVPDFIYDAARLFHLVLVGYSANDPPMRYLLNAVAADGSRFDDLKERFTFIGTSAVDSVSMEDWKGRGITPIWYDSKNNHEALRITLEKWAILSAINGDKRRVDATIRRIVKHQRVRSSQLDRDLFDHLLRRANSSERVRIADLATKAKADMGWLDAIFSVTSEHE